MQNKRCTFKYKSREREENMQTRYRNINKKKDKVKRINNKM